MIQIITHFGSFEIQRSDIKFFSGFHSESGKQRYGLLMRNNSFMIVQNNQPDEIIIEDNNAILHQLALYENYSGFDTYSWQKRLYFILKSRTRSHLLDVTHDDPDSIEIWEKQASVYHPPKSGILHLMTSKGQKVWKPEIYSMDEMAFNTQDFGLVRSAYLCQRQYLIIEPEDFVFDVHEFTLGGRYVRKVETIRDSRIIRAVQTKERLVLLYQQNGSKWVKIYNPYTQFYIKIDNVAWIDNAHDPRSTFIKVGSMSATNRTLWLDVINGSIHFNKPHEFFEKR